MKRFICTLIVAVMLIGILPITFASAAEILYTPIGLDTPTKVTLSRTHVEEDFTFTAPEDGTYVFYSIGDCDTVGYVFDVTDGSPIMYSDDYSSLYGNNFKVNLELIAGEKVNLKVTLYDFNNVGTFDVVVAKRDKATGIVTEFDVIDVYVGDTFQIAYDVFPMSAIYEWSEYQLDGSLVVDIDKYGDFHALKAGTTVVKLKSENGHEKSVTVNVSEPEKLELDKEIKIIGKNDFQFTFTPAETGYYNVVTNGPEIYAWIDGADYDHTYTVYRLEKDVEYTVFVDKYVDVVTDSIVIKKINAATAVDIYSEDTVFYSQDYSYMELLPDDGYIDGTIEWTVDDAEIAEIGVCVDNCAELYFKKAGTVKVTATLGALTDTVELTVVEPGILTLDTPYVKNLPEYERLRASFTAPEDGMYIVSAEDALGDSIIISLIGDYRYDDHAFYAEKDEVVYIEFERSSPWFDSGDITVKVKLLPEAVSASFKYDALDMAVGDELNLEAVPDVEGGFLYGGIYWEVSETGYSELFNYIDPSTGTFYADFIPYEKGEYTVTLDVGGVQDTIKINVGDRPEAKLDTEVRTPVKEYNGVISYSFTPEKTGLYSIDVGDGAYYSVKCPDYIVSEGGNAIFMVGGIEYVLEFEIEKEITELVFTVRNSVFTTQIEEYNRYIQIRVGEYYSVDIASIDGDTYEEVAQVNVADTAVASAVSDGYRYFIVANSVGETTAEIVSVNGAKTTVPVIVLPENYEFAIYAMLNMTELELDIGKSEQLTVTTEPADESKSVYWWSEDEAVVRVDGNGRVTAIKKGTATVCAYVDGIILWCDVTVKEPAVVDSSKVFTDIKAGKWYSKAIDHAYSYGFIAGVSKTEFGLNDNITRGMFITILARIAGVDTSGAANKAATTKFEDVKVGKYYTAAIKWASENGVVAGITETTFKPDAFIERQQICVMLVNFAKYMNVEMTASKEAINFADADKISKYAKTAVATAQLADVIAGYNNAGTYTFKPKENATRGEAAQMLYKFHTSFILK